MLDANNKTFVMHMVIQEREEIPMYFKKKTQIKAQVGALLFNKAPTEISAEYFDYNNVFSMKHIAELPKNTGLNEHAIELEIGKQSRFGLIYSLKLVELETLKTYININLANGFI